MGENRFRVTPERYHTVLKEISEGSEPEIRFYLMVAVSTMIASFGLITNSTAVIIGAMLVAPLMTPIFGIALALVRGDVLLFGKAFKAEVVGVAAAISMGFVLGTLYPALEPTQEMIARTEPQLFDLLVAVFSGFAGAYALLDEKISPALPGVAIATAIVPPLANTGLCFSGGQYIAGVGSFLLFFANFLSILLVASAVFWVFGIVGRVDQLDKKIYFKRFSLPVVCFILVAGFLTRTLVNIAQNHYLNEAIQTTLQKELFKYPDTSLDGLRYDERDNIVYVFAGIQSSRVITPTQVSRLQDSLQKEIDLPTKLIVRSKMARDISALGSDIQLGKQKLDGSFVTQEVHPRVRDVKISDTAIRNYLANIIGFELDFVRIFQVGSTPTVVAHIYGINAPGKTMLQEMEVLLRDELANPKVKFVVSFIETKLFDRTGLLRLEFSGLSSLDDELKKTAENLVSLVKGEILSIKNLYFSNVNYNYIEGKWFVLVEVNGPQMLSQKYVAEIEDRISKKINASVNIFVFMHGEMIMASTGHVSYSSILQKIPLEYKNDQKENIQRIIDASNY